MWFTPWMAPAALFTGTLAAAPFIGLSFAWGSVAIILGITIGCVATALLSAMGPRQEWPSCPSQLPFGKSVAVPGGINWLSQILFLGRH